MQIGLLGPIEAWADGRQVPLAGPRQRTVLALLAIHANQVVSADRLVDDLWAGEPPETARKSLQVYVSRLRKLLGNGDSPLLTRPPGYMLKVDPDQLDALQFERLAQQGHQLLSATPELAATHLREALALWRGPALADLTSEPALAPGINRLEEARIGALEDRIEADLELGRHRELIGELDALCQLYPFRERFTGQLMVALYRGGRQAEALRVFQSARRRLIDELGLEPSPALGQLEERILQQDPELVMVSAPPGPRVAPVMRGYELRDRLDQDRWGVRYRGYQAATGSEVIIKVLDPVLGDRPEFIRKFEFEAARLSRLRHPNLAPLIDYWRDQEGAYLVSRWYAGGSLADRLPSIGWEDALELLERVATAIDAAHQQGAVHGNLSASKIHFDQQGGVFLADFGLAHDLVDESRATPGSDRESLWALAEELITAHPGRLPAGGISGTGLKGTLDQHPTAAELIAGLARPDRVSRQSVTGEIPNPYKGLRAFVEADEEDFFGREELVDELVRRLSRSGVAGRLVAVVGPSGGGKSSLVRAGLIPAVHAGRIPGSEKWFIARMVPGALPFEELEACLLRLAVNPPASLIDQLHQDSLGLHRAVLRVLPEDDSELLLVIDQFEELFTSADESAATFLDVLAAAIAQSRSRLRLAITLRADFYDRPLGHAAFADLLREGLVTITGMQPHHLEQAIVGPARRVSVAVEPTLVSVMVADVANQPAALPLLQYALTELFDRRTGDPLSLDHYREIGGVQGALVSRAEGLFQNMSDHARAATRHILLRLVAIEEGVEVARRRVPRGELMALQLDSQVIDQVLEVFGQARLFTFDRDRVTRSPTVEVAHEALLHRWDRLSAWIEQAGEDLRMHRRLATMVREWLSSDRQEGYLLSSERLEEFLDWDRKGDVALTGSEREYLESSLRHQENVAQAESRRLAHEHDLERQAGARLRLLVWVMGIAATLGLVLTAVALDRAAAARREGARAEAVGLSTAAIANSDRDPQLALYLALQAVQVAAEATISVPLESEAALHMALQAGGVTYPVVDAPVQVAAGLGGNWAYYRLPMQQLTDLARSALVGLPASDQCLLYLRRTSCPLIPEFSLPADTPVEPEDLPEKPLAGTQVTTLGLSAGDADRGLLAALAEFRHRTEITVVLDSRLEDFDEELAGDSPGLPADLVFLWLPTDVARLAGEGRLIEIGRYLDPDQLAADFPPHLISLGSVDGRLYGGTWNAQLKSTIWYPVQPFRDAGYQVPTTWGELMQLSRQIVSDGGTPWCIGDESGEADGWPATDWIEDILLHSEGPAVYDDWVNHRIPFDHPAVVRAATRLGEIYFTEGFVLGGASGALATHWFDAERPLLTNPPECWLWHFPTFAVSEAFSGSRVGADVDFFPFPSINPEFKDTAVGGTGTLVAFRDAPEVREVVRFLLGADWGPNWAATDPYLFAFPANRQFPLHTVPNGFRANQFKQLQEALASDGFRFDGSDMMPPEVGQGSFWRGMVDYIESGPDSLDRVLGEIEASWPNVSEDR